MRLAHRILALIAFLLAFAGFASAQVTTGKPPFGSFSGGPDTVNNANLNVNWVIPVLQKAGRGTTFTYDLAYDSSVWYPVGTSGSQSWHPVSTFFGWQAEPSGLSSIMYGTYQMTANQSSCWVMTGGTSGYEVNFYWYTFSGFTFYDEFGTPHSFPAGGTFYTSPGGSECPPYGGSFTPNPVKASDGSGYTLTGQIGPGTFSGTLTNPSGTVINVSWNQAAPSSSVMVADRNGNELSFSSGNYYDTLNATTPVLTVSGSGTPSSPTKFTYTAPSTGSASYTMKYTTQTVRTNFGCSGISEWGPYSESLVSEIDLPDDNPNGTRDRYTYTYETTPGYSSDVTGRLASITLPTGGTISYSYSGGNNGINCSDGSAATVTRTTPDGTWTYAQVKGSGAASTTTFTDPAGDQTVLQFQGIYETQRQISQLVSGTQTTLKTINTCYNGSSTPCTGTAVSLPIAQRQIDTVLSGELESEHDDYWNTYGLPTETQDYDYGNGQRGSLLKEVLTTYASLGNSITGFSQQVTVENGSGTTVAQTNYSYDQTAVVATSGTPQHASVSGSRGNLTGVTYYTVGSTSLTKTLTYFDTGNIQSVTDVNSAQTTYNYSNSTSTCGNAFPTSVSEPLSLSISMTWNCTGGVQLTSTDENGKTTTTAYTDSYFWRPASVTDPTGAVTNYCYGLSTSGSCSPNPNQTEATLTFNSGSSAVDTLTTLDEMGRRHLSQKRQTPSSSSFDTVETDYDNFGRVDRVTVPYTAGEGQTNSSAPATTTTYDALNRRVSVTDGGGGTLTYSYGTPSNPYNQYNDVLVTRGPKPTGENLKQRQFEHDALGRLTSVCEVTAGTSAWPGGTCGQNTPIPTPPATAYWTKYTYDPLGDLLSVTQNAQSSSGQQTRSYSYDLMSRLTSETNPESGTTTYAYDSDSTCGTSDGDLVKEVDAVGNVICGTDDALHRVTSMYVSSGTYASVSPRKCFTYDSATVDSVAMSNTYSRMAEAFTTTGSCSSGSKKTDIGLSYSVRGEITNVYEDTPHSGGYYLSSLSYWANGAADVLAAPGIPNITYAPDGEGRISTVSAASGQNPVTATAYNSFSLPTSVTFGSADNDAYQYDPNTGRMKQYQLNVGTQSDTGVLTWNQNGSLSQLQITDQMNSADTQTCTNSQDDLGRIATDNCGSAWSQTFSYDPFGNLSKSGTQSFQPIYYYSGQPITNRYIPFSGFTATYDANGNVTADPNTTYSWDAYGRPIIVDGMNLTYDALGRMVEENMGSNYDEFDFTPTGAKLALMSGQTLVKAFVSLPGGAQAVYTSSGLAYYRHKDWLGSSRLASTPTRTTFSDTALAPYGEAYAQSGTTDLNFTGMNQDVASGVYDFPAREYGAVPGRWPSPDPAGLAAVNPGNPQSWNRYAYVQNDPLSLTDPQGLDCEVTVGGTVMGYISGCGGEISSSGGGASGVGWDSAFACDIGPSSNCGTSGGVGDDDNLLCVTGNTTIPAPPGGLPIILQSSTCVPWTSNFQNLISGGSGGSGGGGSWAWTFTKTFLSNFVSLSFYKQELQQGGCLNTFVGATGNAVVPSPQPSLSSTAGAGTVAVSAAMRYNAAQAYAASQTNVLGGQGLIFPQKSIPYNNILEGSAVANLAEGGLGYVDGALFQGLVSEAAAAYNGNCH